MANFRIDKLYIKYNGKVKNNYEVSGICNNISENPPLIAPIIGLFSKKNRHILFDTGAHSNTDELYFVAENVDFTNYDSRDMVILSFGDQQTPGSRKRNKGSVVVVNTDYPPPTTPRFKAKIKSPMALASPHQDFTSQFWIEELNISRVTALLDIFTIQIKLGYESQDIKFIEESGLFIEEPHNKIDVITLNVDSQQNPGTNTGTLEFNISGTFLKPLNLSNYETEGLSIVVKESSIGWESIDTKMSLLFVE